MLEIEVEIMNRAGMHTRPAASLVKLSASFKSEIFLIKDGFSINAKSIIGVMTLAAAQHTKLILKVEGEDENKAAKEIAELFKNGFGEL
ncbi:MAG: HPr family phosphocarrier protein [Bacteroidota bacterium]